MPICENCEKKVSALSGNNGLLPNTLLCGKCKPIVYNVFFEYSKDPETGIERLKSDYASGQFPDLTKSGYDHILSSLDDILKKKKDAELLKEKEIKDFEKYQDFTLAEQDRVRSIVAKLKEEDFPVYSITGVRGRSLTVYRDRCVINTQANAGSFITGNATDGEKTIFYHDVIGIQFKPPGMTIGYLQLETASGFGNNESSNMFAENTFTFEKDLEIVEEAKDYIIYQVSLFKHLP